MANFSSKEIESHYNLIKMLLSDKKKYLEALKVKRKLEKINIFYRKKILNMVSI